MKDAGTWAPEMVSLMKRNNCVAALTHSRTLMEIVRRDMTQSST